MCAGFIIDLLFSVRSLLQIDVFGTMKKKKREVIILTNTTKKFEEMTQGDSQSPVTISSSLTVTSSSK